NSRRGEKPPRMGGRQSLRIELHIERLSLDGLSVSPRERALVLSSVEAELSRLLAEGGLSHELLGGGALPSLRAGDLRLTAGSDARHLGMQIARAVYDGIGADAAPRAPRRPMRSSE